MRIRVILGRFLVRLGRFIESLAVAVMRPADLMEYTRRNYAKPSGVEGWSRDEIVNAGFDSVEKLMLDHLPLKSGRLLLLGLGGGRDAIALAQMGFDVTGVDFIPGMIERAMENARRKGVKIEAVLQEITSLDMPPASYDVAWLSAFMYSCFPTRKRRIAMLKRIARAIKPSGYFLCQFAWDRNPRRSPLPEIGRKVFAFLTLGNFWYERGDVLWGGVEFLHHFSSPAELEAEFEAGGFKVLYAEIPQAGSKGGAVLRKRSAP